MAASQFYLNEMSNVMNMCDYKCDLNAVGKKRAWTELGEIESDLESAVEALREWVLAQSDWLRCPTDTQFLLAFLRHRKFSQKAAKDRLVQYCEIRSKHTDWFSNIDTHDESMQEYFKRGIFQFLPKRDKDGCAVLIIRLGPLRSHDMKSTDFVRNIIRSFGASQDHLLRSDMTQVCGLKILQDFTDVSVDKLIHVEKLLSEGLRIHSVTVHKTLKTVYELIDMSVLPVQYLPDDYTGPNGGDINEIAENFAAKMKQTEIHDFVLHMSDKQHMCDVKKRPSDVIPTESYRSLHI